MTDRPNPSQRREAYRGVIAALALSLPSLMGAAIKNRLRFDGGHFRKFSDAGPRHLAGSKIARKMAKAAGREWRGEIFHGGELTKASAERSARRKALREVA